MKNVITTAALIVLMTQPVLALSIVYSWEGTIEPLQVDKDPWEIGAAGKPFFVSVGVFDDARDFQDQDVNVANFGGFDIFTAELLIDGTPALFQNFKMKALAFCSLIL